VPLTDEQKAERALLKEREKAERQLEREERLLAEKQSKAERKPHAAWRLRFDKATTPVPPTGRITEAVQRTDVRNDMIFAQRVEAACAASAQWGDTKRAAVMTLPPDLEAGMGSCLHRVCEVFIVLHTKRAAGEMKQAVSKVAQLHKCDWVPAKPGEWDELDSDYRVLRDETPPTASDARLLLAALGADAPPGEPKKKRPSGTRPRKSGKRRKVVAHDAGE